MVSCSFLCGTKCFKSADSYYKKSTTPWKYGPVCGQMQIVWCTPGSPVKQQTPSIGSRLSVHGLYSVHAAYDAIPCVTFGKVSVGVRNINGAPAWNSFSNFVAPHKVWIFGRKAKSVITDQRRLRKVIFHWTLVFLEYALFFLKFSLLRLHCFKRTVRIQQTNLRPWKRVIGWENIL